jgi:2-polyprenyl-3-methyl-5-hydroxy-6-metoxy-1,4-benzoquinol methylase
MKDGGQILDFGSSVGELGHLVSKNGVNYAFIETEEHAVDYLQNQLRKAKRVTLQGAQLGAYDVVFAIDSLEHNENYAELLTELASKLAPGGVLILSGPTESNFYRLGRRIAGFDGHYHETTIYAIEAEAARLLDRVAIRSIPPIAPLFRITAWRRKGH